MASVIHMAGTPVTICGRTIQRCSICGEKMIDTKNQERLLDSNPKHTGVWDVHSVVLQRDGYWILMADQTHLVPSESCLVLVED